MLMQDESPRLAASRASLSDVARFAIGSARGWSPPLSTLPSRGIHALLRSQTAGASIRRRMVLAGFRGHDGPTSVEPAARSGNGELLQQSPGGPWATCRHSFR